jgi:hypothetical protein
MHRTRTAAGSISYAEIRHLGKEWVNGYMSSATCRNVLIDVLHSDAATASDRTRATRPPNVYNIREP